MYAAMVVTNSVAQTVLMGTDSGYTTTGELLEGVRDGGITTNVQEVVYLWVTARTDDPDHRLNANSESFGINNLTKYCHHCLLRPRSHTRQNK